jgi:hypothetical protein
MRALLFVFGVLLVIVPEVLRVYYIMPFPGSQENTATDPRQVDIAYWLHTNIWWVRLIGLAVLLGPLLHYMRNGGMWKRIAVLVPLALCALVFYAFNFKFMADKMFYPPQEKSMRAVAVNDSTTSSLVIAVERNNDARAYPIELIGYHHQVLDTIGGEPVLITYCTVCRTGRAWKPVVNGQPETFRLVGMDHFNAMFEDSRTKSWWRQVTGECIEGPLKGQQLEEVPSEQLSLAEFAARHPKGLVFQPDPHFAVQYAALRGYDDGSIASSLETRDTAGWRPKSWVVGVVHKGQARAYDWNDVVRLHTLHDTIAGDPISVVHTDPGFVVVVDNDTNRVPMDIHKGSAVVVEWTWPYQIPAYQEFWHSWRTFHPNTTRYEPKR